MNTFFEKILQFYSITDEDYKKLIRPVNSDMFINEHSFNNMSDAVSLLNNAIKNHEKIHIYGDYDADGIMGTSILVKMFQYLNYPVSYYIPNRYIDGYGLNLLKAKEIVEEKVKLVICVDNGVSAYEAIEHLKQNDINVLVLDHHEAGEPYPKADVIVHPFISKYGKYSSSGAFVAFCFSINVLGRFDKYLSTLASISLISDMMPLKEYNRDLLRIVISNYKENEFLSIDLLKENDPFNETTIGMRIAPKINSVGRLTETGSLNDIVKFFTSCNKDEILHYNSWISSLNEQRKELSKNSLYLNDETLNNINGIVLEVEEKEGIIGLIANNLMNKFSKPTIVFSYNKNLNILKGSCRSKNGFNVVEFFDYCKDILTASGGHALAGGCSITRENFEVFKNRFDEFAKNHPFIDDNKNTIAISILDINMDNYKILQTFAPFGEEWKSPIFNLQNINVSSLKYSKTLEHIFTPIGINTRIIGFNISKKSLDTFSRISMNGNFKISEFRGINYLDFNITEIIK